MDAVTTTARLWQTLTVVTMSSSQALLVPDRTQNTIHVQKALSSAAMARAKAGDVQGALRDLRDLARRFPWNCRIPVSAATLEVRRRNYPAARELFKLAVMAGRPDNDHIPIKVQIRPSRRGLLSCVCPPERLRSCGRIYCILSSDKQVGKAEGWQARVTLDFSHLPLQGLHLLAVIARHNTEAEGV